MEEELIATARATAKSRDTTLNALVRKWIQDYTDGASRRERLERMFEETKDLDLSGHRLLTREQMNERR